MTRCQKTTWLFTIGVVATSIVMSSSAASAADHAGPFSLSPRFKGETSPTLYWNSPVEKQSFSRISQEVVPSNITRSLFWATVWWWDGPAPNGAYAGFQTADYDLQGNLPGLAIFSIWDATDAVAAPGAWCGPFGNEGEGLHCLAPLTVVANHRYRTVIETDHIANGKQWWRAYVSDVTVEATVQLGTIEAANAYMATMPASFLEYYGPKVKCWQTPFVTSVFDAPVVTPAGTNDDLAGSFKEGSAGDCPSSTYTPTETGASVTTGGPKPFMPFLFAPAVSQSRVKITWRITSDGGSPIQKEIIQASKNGEAWTIAGKAGSLATSKTLRLSPGQYSFRIAAVNASGRGAWSAASSPVTITSASEQPHEIRLSTSAGASREDAA